MVLVSLTVRVPVATCEQAAEMLAASHRAIEVGVGSTAAPSARRSTLPVGVAVASATPSVMLGKTDASTRASGRARMLSKISRSTSAASLRFQKYELDGVLA